MRLHYDFSEYDDDYPISRLITVSARDDDGFEVSITTNRRGEGLWEWDSCDHSYRQVLGTCQYRLPGSKQGIRRELRALYLKKIDDMREMARDREYYRQLAQAGGDR